MFSSSASSVGATRNDDGTVTVRYKLPYAYVFIENVQQYIDSYDAANPTAPMEYDYTTLKESIPWMEILFYLGMLGCTGFLLFSMMRGGAGGGGIMINWTFLQPSVCWHGRKIWQLSCHCMNWIWHRKFRTPLRV